MQQRNFINFYLVLNVSPKTSTKEIKKAYLKLAQTYHPDKNRGNKLAEKRFQQINQAWQVLKDAKQRELFDKDLERVKKNQAQKNLSQFKPFYQAPPVIKKKEKPIDLEIPLQISLEDVCQSRSKKIHYFKSVNGEKIKSSFVVQIPSGVKQGFRLRFKGKGGSEGKKNFGDLYIKILIKPHPVFQLTGNSGDLLLDRPISFIEAVQGKKLDIPSPYGFLAVDLNPPVKNEQILKITGYGLPKNPKGDKGDLFVKIFIDYPTQNNIKIQNQMKSLSFEQQKIYVEKFKNSPFIYPKVLKFQKKMQELKKK